jgi:putative transposase
LAGDKKTARRKRAWIVIIDESGALLAPLVKRTLAPIGKTPVLRQQGRHRQKVSMIGALTCSPVNQRLRLYFALHKDLAFNHERVAVFLRELLRHLPGKLLVIWDNGQMHKGPAVRKLLAKSRRLRVFALPPYAPECDPVESIWSTLKVHRLANDAPANVHELYHNAWHHLRAMSRDADLLAGCFRHSWLGLPRPCRTLLR